MLDEKLKIKIEFEISQINALVEKSSVLVKKCEITPPDFVRHFFRHAYGQSIQWDKAKPLFMALEENWIKIKEQIEKFLMN